MTPKILPVTAAIIKKENKILIAQRLATSKSAANKWEFPGGKIDFGEDPKETIVREIKEELNLTIKNPKLKHITSHIYKERPNLQILPIFFEAEYESGELKLIDCQDAKWIKAEELSNYDFAEADLEVVEMLKK